MLIASGMFMRTLNSANSLQISEVQNTLYEEHINLTMGKTAFLMFLNAFKENFSNFHPEKIYFMNGFQLCTKASLYIEKCNGIKKYGKVMILTLLLINIREYLKVASWMPWDYFFPGFRSLLKSVFFQRRTQSESRTHRSEFCIRLTTTDHQVKYSFNCANVKVCLKYPSVKF